MTTRQAGSPIIPTMRYKDAAAAVEWLCKAFGFERKMVVPDGDGGVAHAELVSGPAMVMIGHSADDEFGRLVSVPADLNGANTQTAYLIVEAIDAHYARAKAAGAEIVFDIRDEDYGGRGYSCRDPEGYIWNFGSYDPWAS